jgi:hypothetical protein
MTHGKERLESILNSYREGSASLEQTREKVQELFYKDLGHTKLDTHRGERTGHPEVVFCRGKSTEQVRDILSAMRERNVDILATRMDEDMHGELSGDFPEGEYHADAQIFSVRMSPREDNGNGEIAVVSAGTADFRVAEEAAVSASFYGHRVVRYNDVGVAGIHRLLNSIDDIREARVIIVVAGMEGALAGVVGGLVSAPVIAVPTSVGYGANFQGLSALLTMLNSCSSGVSVVNIDNGFGAGYLAAMINAL